MPRLFVVSVFLFVASGALAAPAIAADKAEGGKAEPASKAARPPAERTVAKLSLDGEPGKKVEVWLTRTRSDDGGVTIKLVAKGVAPKPQALTIYQGGGDDDGAGDDEIRKLELAAVALPGGAQAARVDMTYRQADSKHEDLRIETTLVGFRAKTHKLLTLETGLARARNKNCHESEASDLTVEKTAVDKPAVDKPAVEEGGFELVVSARHKVDPVLGDDDLPVDKSCRARKAPVVRRFKWDAKADAFIDPSAQAEESGDDE